jgi:hypothetical protein
LSNRLFWLKPQSLSSAATKVAGLSRGLKPKFCNFFLPRTSKQEKERAMKSMLMILLGVGIAAFVVIHIVWYIKPSDIKTSAELDRKLRDGQPTVVEFYSNL